MNCRVLRADGGRARRDSGRPRDSSRRRGAEAQRAQSTRRKSEVPATSAWKMILFLREHAANHCRSGFSRDAVSRGAPSRLKPLPQRLQRVTSLPLRAIRGFVLEGLFSHEHPGHWPDPALAEKHRCTQHRRRRCRSGFSRDAVSRGAPSRLKPLPQRLNPVIIPGAVPRIARHSYPSCPPSFVLNAVSRGASRRGTQRSGRHRVRAEGDGGSTGADRRHGAHGGGATVPARRTPQVDRPAPTGRLDQPADTVHRIGRSLAGCALLEHLDAPVSVSVAALVECGSRACSVSRVNGPAMSETHGRRRAAAPPRRRYDLAGSCPPRRRTDSASGTGVALPGASSIAG